MRKQNRAFTMLEVVLSVLFFTMMTLLVAVSIPMAARSSRQSSDTVQASSLLRHKIDQLQGAGYSQMNGVDLKRLNVIDNAGMGVLNSPNPTANANGDQSGDAPFTRADNLEAFFVNASSHPEGHIEIAPYQPSVKGSGGGTYYTVIQATVSVRWKDTRGQVRSLSMRTLIPKTTLQ
jgi:type II secretory pathway pseudopilin PulG